VIVPQEYPRHGRPIPAVSRDKIRMLTRVRFAAAFRLNHRTRTFAHRTHASEINIVSANRFAKSSPSYHEALPAVDSNSSTNSAPPNLLPEIAGRKESRNLRNSTRRRRMGSHPPDVESLPAGASPTIAWGVTAATISEIPPLSVFSENWRNRIRFDGMRRRHRMADDLCRRLRILQRRHRKSRPPPSSPST